ncbi:Hypothetical predicted protein, partial [Podarcis lilfordi]
LTLSVDAMHISKAKILIRNAANWRQETNLSHWTTREPSFTRRGGLERRGPRKTLADILETREDK